MIDQEDDTTDLIAAARDAMAHAYAPYSRFAVGAALRLTDGRIVTGANVENASYGLSLCAETVAIAKVANEGRLADVVAVAVVGGMMDKDGTPRGSDPVMPCGRCRQLINEAAALGNRPDLPILCGAAEGDAIAHHALAQLLPFAFGPDSLQSD